MTFYTVMPPDNWCKVLLAIALTVALFATGFYLSETWIDSFLHVVVFACVLILSGLVLLGLELLAWKIV
jgi:hypothetical protein